MSLRRYSYLSPKLAGRSHLSQGGQGVFARERVPAGELLVVWCGYLVDWDGLQRLTAVEQSRSLQVEDRLYLVPNEDDDPADYFNHSCNPNAFVAGQITLLAAREILPGEEVCYDYAMTDGSSYDEFSCRCGASNCRQHITGDDWMLSELQERYAGHFSPYIQRRIQTADCPDHNEPD